MSQNNNSSNNSSTNGRYYSYGSGNSYQSSGFQSGSGGSSGKGNYPPSSPSYHLPYQQISSGSGSVAQHQTSTALNHQMIGQQQRGNFRSGYSLPHPPASGTSQGVSSSNNSIKSGLTKRKSDMELQTTLENGQQIVKKIKTEGEADTTILIEEAEPSIQVYDFSSQEISRELDEKLACAHTLLDEQLRIKPNFMALTSSEAARLQVDFFPSKLLTDEFINELKNDLFEDPECFKRCVKADCEEPEPRSVFCMVDDLNKIMDVLKLDTEMNKRKEEIEKDLDKKEKEHNQSSKRRINKQTKKGKAISQRRSSSISEEDSVSESDEFVSHSQSSRDTSARGRKYNKKKKNNNNNKTLIRKSSKRILMRRGGGQEDEDDEEEDSNIYNTDNEDNDDGDDYNDNNDDGDSDPEVNQFNEIGVDDQDDEDYIENKAKKIIVRKKKDEKGNPSNNHHNSNNNQVQGESSAVLIRKGARQKLLRIDDDDEKQEKTLLQNPKSNAITDKSDQEHLNTNTTNNYSSRNIHSSSQYGSTSQMEIESELKIENRLLKFRERENQLASREADFEKRQRVIMERQQKIMQLHYAFATADTEHQNAARNLEIIHSQFQLS